MEEIKNWAFSVCAAVICGAVMNMLLPEGNFLKIYKCVLCVFFLCVVASPIADIKLPDSKKIYNFNVSESVSDAEFVEISEEIIEKKITDDTTSLLSEEGIYCNDISISINISENGGIDINKFSLTLDQNCDFNMIKEKVRQKIGVEPEIIVSGEK